MKSRPPGLAAAKWDSLTSADGVVKRYPIHRPNLASSRIERESHFGHPLLKCPWLKSEPQSQLPAPACCQACRSESDDPVCLGLWLDFRTSNPEVGELSRNHGLAKVGIPAQAFYEDAAKVWRPRTELGFQQISTGDVSQDQMMLPMRRIMSSRLILVVSSC